jgi:hypothetical protein
VNLWRLQRTNRMIKRISQLQPTPFATLAIADPIGDPWTVY